MSALHDWAAAAAPKSTCRSDVLADVDEVVVERACRGEGTDDLTRAEMAEAFLRLDGEGNSAKRIAELLGVSQRTVVRWRSGRHFPCSLPRGAGHGGSR